MSRPTRLLAVTTAGLLCVGVAAPAVAHGKNPAPDGPTVVASGLNMPRHLSAAPNGDLYVAESGTGGTPGEDPCVEHPELGVVCLGTSGSVTQVSRKGGQTRVVTGLPSAGNAEEATGPFDVLVEGSKLVVVIGLGGNQETRDLLGGDAQLLGTVVSVRTKGPDRQPHVIGDPVAHEEDENPAGPPVDSNPVDLAQGRGGSYVVTDAGGNDVLSLRHGEISTLAVLDPVLMDPPPFPPEGEWPVPFPADPVPTATAQGPDGAWYVSQLTGFPFQPGSSTIWRLEDGELEPYATGLTNVTDLAWDGDTLYAVQLVDAGLLSGQMTGSLLRVSTDGQHETVAGDLLAPYGVAIDRGSAYVTTCSVCAGGGEVLRVPLG